MHQVNTVTVTAGGGLEGDHSKSAKRGITLLSAPQWSDVITQLGFDLPWHSRRANVLVDAPDLGGLVGKTVRIGAVEVLVNGITYPCAHIDEMHPGLRAALTGDRGGVYGKILCDGTISVGDRVALAEPGSLQ